MKNAAVSSLRIIRAGRSRWCAFGLTVAIVLSISAFAGEVILSENFESLDLKKIPSGAVAGKDITIVASTPDRGKVLRIKNAANAVSTVTINLDIKKVHGHSVKVSVLAQLPGTFQPIPSKTYAKPKILLMVKGKDGKENHAEADPEPGKPEWQNLSMGISVPADAQSSSVVFKVETVEAEVFFDDLSVELDAVATASASNPPPPPPPDTPEIKAAKAPKKSFEDGGIVFSPEIAANLQQKDVKISGRTKSLLLVGCGLPNKDYESGLPSDWPVIAAPKELIGPTAVPVHLLSTLGDVLAKQKPEVVILFGEAASVVKNPDTESFDWSDTARLCLRMGAIPVLAIPASTGQAEKDAVYKAMLEGGQDALCPMLEMKGATVPHRIAEITILLEKYVFCRIPLDAAGKTKSKDQPED